MTSRYQSSLEMHRIHTGKMETVSKVPLENSVDLSLAYSPGVAEPCLEIRQKPLCSIRLYNQGESSGSYYGWNCRIRLR